jgi:hypothetical protein
MAFLVHFPCEPCHRAGLGVEIACALRVTHPLVASKLWPLFYTLKRVGLRQAINTLSDSNKRADRREVPPVGYPAHPQASRGCSQTFGSICSYMLAGAPVLTAPGNSGRRVRPPSRRGA